MAVRVARECGRLCEARAAHLKPHGIQRAGQRERRLWLEGLCTGHVLSVSGQARGSSMHTQKNTAPHQQSAHVGRKPQGAQNPRKRTRAVVLHLSLPQTIPQHCSLRAPSSQQPRPAPHRPHRTDPDSFVPIAETPHDPSINNRGHGRCRLAGPHPGHPRPQRRHQTAGRARPQTCACLPNLCALHGY